MLLFQIIIIEVQLALFYIYNNVDDISVGAHSHKFHITICDIIFYILNKMGLTAV